MIHYPLSTPPRDFRLWPGAPFAQAAAELFFGGGQEGRIAERAAGAAEARKAGEFGLRARRHFQKFAKARRNIGVAGT